MNLLQFTIAVEKYQIIEENIYNFDKKMFMIRVGITVAQVMILKKIKGGKIIKAS